MKVTVSTSRQYSIRLGSKPSLKVNLSAENTILANNFTDLNDVDITNLSQTKDNYVVIYDADAGKFKIVDPDSVLSAASTATGPQPGLPADFVGTLDVDLDNKIDVDAGSF